VICLKKNKKNSDKEIIEMRKTKGKSRKQDLETKKQELEEGQVIGMEVFTTTGEGMVKESSPTLIYMLKAPKPVRLRESRKILELVLNEYQTLPFARRWLKDIGSQVGLQLALRELVSKEILHEYPPLREKSNAPVAQAEETIIVKEKPIITTKS